MKLINIKEGQPTSHPDPYILKANDGKYYVYTTGGKGVHGYVADTLTGDYKYLGLVLEIKDCYNFWAPCVIYTHGKYYMYTSCMCDNYDNKGEAMHVASSNTPFGPFVNAKKMLEPFSIDPHVVENETGLYMFYSTNGYEYKRKGTYIVIDKMLDPETLVGNPKSVVRPSIDEEISRPNGALGGGDWHTIEGAFYFKEGDYHYVIYSGSAYGKPCYFLGYSVAKTNELDLTKIDYKKYPDDDTYLPLLAKNDFEEGTGHNSVIKDNGEYYIVYHGRDYLDLEKEVERRTARICKMKVDKEKLTAIRYMDKL